jgi:hypothetical protein
VSSGLDGRIVFPGGDVEVMVSEGVLDDPFSKRLSSVLPAESTSIVDPERRLASDATVNSQRSIG